MINTYLFLAAAVCYAVGGLGYIAYLWRLSAPLRNLGLGGVLLGLFLQLLALGWRFSEVGYLPIASFHEAMSFFLWCVLAAFALLQIRYPLAILGSFLSPLALVFLLLAVSASKQPSAAHIPGGPLFALHVVVSFLGEGAFAIACAGAVMYLMQEHYLKRKDFGALYNRLPSLTTVERLNTACLWMGFLFLTAGVGMGFVIAHREWAGAWHWDPKLVFSLAVWLLLALALAARRLQGWSGRRSAWLMVVTFTAVMFTLLGVNFLSDKHRFG
ncbi:MAG: cytochrome c biogenesis protein CcsA [Nitrospirae bacterium]|nr:cytochrome c biogenesis protein CcsA [Nitrospirota bacterium]